MTTHTPDPGLPRVEDGRGHDALAVGSRLTKWITPRTVVGTLALVAVALCLYFTPTADTAWAFARERLDAWKAWVDANFVLAAAVFFVVYVCILTPPVPLAAVVALVGGALFGRWWGTGLMSVASVTAATLAFLLARYLFRDWANRRLGGLMRRINAGFARDGVWYVVALRWMLAIPFFAINMGLGLTPISLRKYVVVSWAAMLPFTFLYAHTGCELAKLDSPKGVLNPGLLVAVGAVAVVPLLLKWVVRRFVVKEDAGAGA
ncbi:MAG: TVP38/TMEM64 family protein [Gemmataceae bacterium]